MILLNIKYAISLFDLYRKFVSACKIEQIDQNMHENDRVSFESLLQDKERYCTVIFSMLLLGALEIMYNLRPFYTLSCK